MSPLGFAWYSIDGSYRLLRQMAHVSVQMAQDHIATAFHFLTSKRLVPGGRGAGAAALAFPLGSGAPVGRSTSMASDMMPVLIVGFLLVFEWRAERRKYV